MKVLHKEQAIEKVFYTVIYAKKVLCMTVSSALVLSSCAGTGGGLAVSSMTRASVSSTPLIFDESALKAGDALVVIRYPAFVDEDAKTYFYQRYTAKTIGDRLENGRSYVDGAEQLAGAFMLKNHYFAVSLYQALQKRLPEATVFLSPHLIEYDQAKGMTSTPVLSSEAVPHALTVDFTTYTFPDARKLLEANAVTFGDLVTPLAVVRTDHHALPGTNGLIAASTPFASTAWADAAAQAQPIALDSTDASGDSHILVDFLAGTLQPSAPGRLRVAKAMTSKIDLGKVDILPVEKIQMKSETVKRLSRQAQGLDADPFGDIYSNDFANRIIAYLNALDLPKTTAAAKQKAVSAFDYDAAHLYFAAADDNAVASRVNFAERLLKAERRYLAGQSQGLAESLAPDQFGRQLAELFVAEQSNLDERRAIARQQNQRAAIAILAAVAAAGAAYGAAKSSSNSRRCDEQDTRRQCENRARNNRSAFRALSTLSLGLMSYGIISARSKSEQGKMVGANFLSTIAPSLNATTDVTVELVEGSEEITAANFPELREKMQTLYSRRMRSMGVSAVPCTFSVPGNGAIGTWYGPCDSGQATGNGYGVITGQGGAGAVEYFGEAVSGFASGTGYLILAGGAGAATVAYEGGFLAGQPHGIVTKTSTGKAAKSGVYENGRRIGRVPSGQPLPQVFSSAPVYSLMSR